MSTPTPPAPDRGAAVHLHLRDDDPAGTALREQLADCLAGGVRDVRVHLEAGADLGVEVLRSLAAADDVLRGAGGGLLLVGATARLRSRLRVHGLARLLPEPAARPGTASGDAAVDG